MRLIVIVVVLSAIIMDPAGGQAWPFTNLEKKRQRGKEWKMLGKVQNKRLLVLENPTKIEF